MLRTIGHIARLCRAAWTLARHDAIFPAEYQQSLPPPARWLGRVARLVAIRGRASNPGERLARALEQLGPSYVKFGQVLATRADVIGADFARGLARLQDKMAPFADATARAIVEKELGQPVDDIFAEFGPPVAAASIAQVHKAVTHEGEALAIKILRPEVERRIVRDIGALRLGAKLAEGLYPKSKRLEPKAFVETVARSLTLELDFRLEAASASELKEAAAAAQNFFIPDVDWTFTTKRVLATQWIDAIAMTDIERVKATGLDPLKLSCDITDAFLSTALDLGVFHADMHAGNLFVTPAGQLWAVDFGIMGRLEASERRYLALILHGFLVKDYDAAAEAHFAAGYVPETHSKADFASALRAVAEPIFGKKASEVPMSRVLMQLFEITDLFDMHLQPQLVLLQKTMVQAEGVCRSLSDEHNMWKASAPAVERFMKRELGPEGIARDVLDDLRRARDAIRALPDTLARLDELADSVIEIERRSAERARQRPQRPLWITALVLSAAVGIGAAAVFVLT